MHRWFDGSNGTRSQRPRPILGASWEGFIINQLVELLEVRRDQRFFWATHGGAELGLLVVRGIERLGFEIKRTSTPKITKSLRSAMNTLHLSQPFVIHAGEHCFPFGEGVEAVSARPLLDAKRPVL